jgi:NADH:quinone reductase (non-electrogenic)
MHRLLILGGGFGGVYAALRLQARAGKRRDVQITLVSRDNYFLFTPMLPQAATSSIDTRHIVQTIRRICPKVKLLQAEIETVDFATRTVTISHAEGHRHQLGYTQLLIAIGGVTNYFGLPGVAEFSLPVKTLTDAIRIRNHALDMLEQAELEEDAELRRRLLTFVVAGAGFAGVETAAELDVFVRRASAQYGNFTAKDIRTVLLDAQSRVLPELSEQLAAFTAATLIKRGMEVRMNSSVRAADAEGVDLTDGSRIPTRTFIWAGGVAPNPLLSALGITNARGRVPVDANLGVVDHPGIWAIGDCASVLPAPDAKPYPPTAQHALREGTHAADNMLAFADGKPLKPFAFTMIGQMANLGERSAVAMVGGLKISGFPAWWLWRTYYLTRIPTLERKLRVAIDWTLDLLFSRDTVKLSMPKDSS